MQGVASWSALSYMAVCMGPGGWICLLSAGAVAGAAAVAAGQLAKGTYEQIMKDMQKVHVVMDEIIQLVPKHSQELEVICETLQKVAEASKILDNNMKSWKEKK